MENGRPAAGGTLFTGTEEERLLPGARASLSSREASTSLISLVSQLSLLAMRKAL